MVVFIKEEKKKGKEQNHNRLFHNSSGFGSILYVKLFAKMQIESC